MRQTVYFLLLVLSLSCSSDMIGEFDLDKKYIVHEGRHDFIPSPLPLPQKAKSVSGSAVLHTSCWYNTLGVDNADFNKLCGFYHYGDIVKNKNSFILAWRPDVKIRDVFELVMYENIDGRNVPKESAVYKVKSSERFTFDFVLVDGKYSLYINGVLLGRQANDKQCRTVGKISAWFGGNRTAPHTMWLYLIF